MPLEPHLETLLHRTSDFANTPNFSFHLFQERSSLRIMSHRQIPSGCPDAPQTPPEADSTEELLTNGSEDPPLEPFGSGDRFCSDLLRLMLRFILTFCSLGLLVICLWQFSGLGPMDKWQQRGFNMLSILLTGITSLGIGSLLGYLGSMLRWPLLAWTMYKMHDVW